MTNNDSLHEEKTQYSIQAEELGSLIDQWLEEHLSDRSRTSITRRSMLGLTGGAAGGLMLSDTASAATDSGNVVTASSASEIQPAIDDLAEDGGGVMQLETRGV